LELEDAKRGNEVIKLLSSFNVANPIEFIKEVMKKSNEFDISGEEITRYAHELKKLEEQEQKPYYQLIDEIENKKKEYKTLDESLKNIKDQITQEMENLEHQLGESKTTLSKLDNYIKTRERLEKNNISIEDISRLEILITNFKQHDYSLEGTIEFFDSTILLRESLEKNDERNKQLVERNQSLLKENDNLESLLQHNMEMYTAVKSFENIEIEPNDVLELIKIVNSMSQSLELSNQEAIDRFIDDVKTQYMQRNSFKFQIEELENLQKMYQHKNALLKEELDILEEVIADRKRIIGAIKRVEALEIKETEIVEWSKILNELGYEVSEFRSMLNEVGGIPKYREIKTREIHELEEREKQLQKNIETLEAKLNSQQEIIKSLHESVQEETNKIKHVIEDFEDFFTSPDTGFKVRTTQIVNDITGDLSNLLKDTRNEWYNDLDTLEKNVEKILKETDRIVENAYIGGRIVGRFHSLESIHKILREDEVSKIEGVIGVITLLTYIQGWLKKNTSEEYAVFDKVIKGLTEDLGDIY
jgi:DNA repair exonuclease SbcCD ATPase subunit